jgi:hypothetical protein
MNEQYAAATMKATLEHFIAEDKQKAERLKAAAAMPRPQQDPNHVRDAVKASIDAMLAYQPKKGTR